MDKQEKYTQLEDFLKSDIGPKQVGNELDETLCDLVHYAGVEHDYARQLPNRYYLLKKLRDIFWALEKSKE